MSREAFDAWYEQYRQTVCMLYGAIDCLNPEDVAFAGWRAAWQAAQADAYDRAAMVCETAEVPIDIDVWMGTKKALTAATAIGLADAIRALAKEPT